MSYDPIECTQCGMPLTAETAQWFQPNGAPGGHTAKPYCGDGCWRKDQAMTVFGRAHGDGDPR